MTSSIVAVDQVVHLVADGAKMNFNEPRAQEATVVVAGSASAKPCKQEVELRLT